jgi:DNA-binding IclR family transcriptional regulator
LQNAEKKEGSKTSSVERALTVLGCFTEDRPSATLTEIAGLTGYYKSTILRLTEQLEDLGYIIRDSAKRYRLGPSVGRLADIYEKTHTPEDDVAATMETLAEATGESVSYLVLRGQERVCRLQINSRHRIRLHLEPGDTLPLDGGASARVLSAFQNNPDPSLSKIRQTGWSVSAGERDPEVASVAIVVQGKSGHLYGALAVSGPLQRFNETARMTALALLQPAVAALSERLP